MWKAYGSSTPGRTLTIEKVVKTNGLTKSRRSVIIQLTLCKSLNYTSKIQKHNQLIALSIFRYILIFFLLFITIKNSLVPMSLRCNSHNGPLSCSVPCYLKLCAKRTQQLPTLLGHQCRKMLRSCWWWYANGCNNSQQSSDLQYS